MCGKVYLIVVILCMKVYEEVRKRFTEEKARKEQLGKELKAADAKNKPLRDELEKKKANMNAVDKKQSDKVNWCFLLFH